MKISTSLLLIILVFNKIEWKYVAILLQKTNLFYLLIAIIFFSISIAISIFRFDLFIRNVGIKIDNKNNSRLYLLGMFYNFFIPGGIGGDAYKAYLLSKSYNKSLKKISKLIFIDRLLGLIAIGFILSILVLFIKTRFSYYINIGFFITFSLVTFFALRFLPRWITAHQKRVYLGFIYSILIQLSQIISILFILKSFYLNENHLTYLFIFLVSSVLSIFSFAGIGIREATFYFGANIFSFNAEVSVSVALIFSLITALFSSFGIIYSLKIINIKLKN